MAINPYGNLCQRFDNLLTKIQTLSDNIWTQDGRASRDAIKELEERVNETAIAYFELSEDELKKRNIPSKYDRVCDDFVSLKEQFRLKTEKELYVPQKLKQEQREAALGAGFYYSFEFRKMCDSYHRVGDTWGNDKMIPFFLLGLYQHYIGESLGYDYTYNYEMWLDSETQKCRFGKYEQKKFESIRQLLNLEPGTSREEILRYVPSIRKMLDKLRENPSFQRLGVDFQRGKVQVERLADKAEGDDLSRKERNEAYRKMLELDAGVEKRQQVIFWWVKDFTDKFRSYISEHPRHLDPDDFNPSDPEFFSNPEYRPLLMNKG